MHLTQAQSRLSARMYSVQLGADLRLAGRSINWWRTALAPSTHWWAPVWQLLKQCDFLSYEFRADAV